MSFGFGLGAGLRALNAARLGIQTAGHNVSNANTPGFTRQRVLLSSALPVTMANGLQMGTGVDVDQISRIIDNSLIARLNFQNGVVAGAELEFQRMSEVEGLFGEPDNGLSQSFASMFGALGSLQSDPADRALRGGAVQSASSLADTFNLLSSRLSQITANTTEEVGGLIQELNGKARQLAAINARIGSIESNGSDANDLRDQRDRLASELAELADVRTIERSSGSLDVLLGGHLLVSGDRASPLSVRETAPGRAQVFGSRSALDIRSGRIGSLLANGDAGVQSLVGELDRLARNLALEMNRVHTTGIPGNGPFQTLTSTLGVQDTDRDGQFGDELLNATGLPFDIQSGELYVNITNRQTGAIERARIDIDPSSMTLQDLADELSSIPNLSANVDPTGRLRVQAASGYGFDFSSRLEQAPNTFGGFGGASPALGTSSAGPFDLSAGGFPKTFTIDVNGALETITLEASEFRVSNAVTAEELAAAINADTANSTARSVGGRLVIRSDSAGESALMSLTDGTGGPLAALGMATGPASGQNLGVSVELTGEYAGSQNGSLTFVPDSDGTIGVTPGLTVGVFNTDGVRIGTLDVGSNYKGERLAVADGIEVKFSQGEISATNNQAFSATMLADSDTSDVLAVLGLNTLFSGDTAATLAVNESLLANTDLFAGGLSAASGDGGNLDRLMELRDRTLGSLDESSIEDFYGDIVNGLGFDVAAARTTTLAEGALQASLQQQRDAISGVNIDEEMVDIVRHQQAYEAAARFISTVQEMTSTLINLGR